MEKRTEKVAESSGLDSLAKSALLLTASSVLIAAAFWPPLYGLAVFVALSPALVAARRAPLKRLFWLSWAAGYLVSLFLYYWIMIVTVAGGLALPIYLGLYLPVFLCGVEVLARRLGVPRIAGAICLWVILEYARGALFSGLPWFFLGHALYRWPRLIQTADIGGVIFLSALVVLINALLAEALARRRRRILPVAVAVLVFLANFAYGAWRFATVVESEGPTVAVIQPNVPQDLKITQTAEDGARIFISLRDATVEAARSADAVFWPETIMPGLVGIEDYWAASGMTTDEIMDELELQGVADDAARRRIRTLLAGGADLDKAIEEAIGAGTVERLMTDSLVASTARLAGRPLVAGAIAAQLDEAGRVSKTFNRACCFDAKGTRTAYYDKVHLVPFGEYVPLRDAWPAAARAIASIMPVEPTTYAGKGFVTFKTGGYVYGPAICFEDTFSYIGRVYRRKGANILLNLTNDGWFDGSFELEAHLGNAVLRTVETRMALVRAANTGISAVVSPRGVVVSRLRDAAGDEREVAGTLVSRVPVSNARTLFTRVGQWWTWAAPVALTAFILMGLRRRG